MVCRTIHVTTHYLRLDPYGFPIVARVDRFLKFALVAEAGALFCVLFLAMFIATLFKRVNGARLALVFGGGYLLLGIFDLEVYRYLRQHINLAYIRTYLRPSVLVDETFLLVLKTDGVGNVLFVIFALSTIGLCTAIYRRISSSRLRPSWMQTMLFGLLGAWLLSSPYWYSPTHSRRDRISPISV